MVTAANVKSVITGSEENIPFVKIKYSGSYDLSKTFDCGQCFRWERVPDSPHEAEFVGVAFEKLLSVASDGNTITIYNTTLEDFWHIWLHYFALDEDYDAIDSELLSKCNEKVFRDAMMCGKGIRILHQDPWEAVCSFIISQNNNIPRIKKIINAMSKNLGKRIDCSGMEKHGASEDAYSFPTAGSIFAAGEKYLYDLKTGFRARYIIDAASKWESGELDPEYIKSIPELNSATEYLCKVKGIGKKVASCALLFGFERYDPFPIDVWMKRVLQKYFDKDFSPLSFGKYAGVAQQYLFDYERNLGNEAK